MNQKRFSVVLLVLTLCLGIAQAQSTSKAKSSTTTSTASGAKIDLNSASQSDLESLPGVGAATAKKIIAGRPYSNASDLSKAGVSQKTIDKITPMVTASGSAPSSEPASAKSSKSSKSESTSASSTPSSGSKIDLNSASQSDLESLPGVGAATAKKIIAGRPYSSASDLSKAGVSQKTIDKISGLVTPAASASSSASSPSSSMSADSGSAHRSSKSAPSSDTSNPSSMSAPASSPSPTPSTATPVPSNDSAAAPAPSHAADSKSTAAAPSGDTKVWVNKDSKVYHLPGDRWYGTTKNGEYMTLSEAERQGYRASKR